MNTILCAFVVSATIAFSSFSHASEFNVQTVSCSSSGSDAKLTYANRLSTPVILKGRGYMCETGFEFLSHRNQKLAGILLVAPTELGLRAKNIVYQISFQDGSANIIGELPVSSERTGDARFLDVFQEGGSAFLDRYDITSNGVSRNPITLELVFDGRLCVQHKEDVWNLETGGKKTCTKIATASFEGPVCLVHKTGKARLSSRRACKPLEDRWRAH